MQVMIVDDEPALRSAIRRALALEGFGVSEASSGEEAISILHRSRADAILLDVLMPGIDGLEVCRRLRAAGDLTPVLILTARETVGDRVAGLDAGADDYLVKPFALEELLARLRALLRRGPGEGSGGERLGFGPLSVDLGARRVTIGDREVELTRTEFSLLELLLRNQGQVLSRSLINERVWGYDFGETSNSLGVYIGYLRRKLESGGETRLIQTVRGVGYVLREAR